MNANNRSQLIMHIAIYLEEQNFNLENKRQKLLFINDLIIKIDHNNSPRNEHIIVQLQKLKNAININCENNRLFSNFIPHDLIKNIDKFIENNSQDITLNAYI